MTVFTSPRRARLAQFSPDRYCRQKTIRCDMAYKPMEKRYLLILTVLLGLVPLSTFRTGAQQDTTRLRVVVNLVQLNVAVTNNKGDYVSGLHPQDFAITQDAIADFVRSLERVDRIAFYSYSRDLYRAAALTSDRSEVVRGVRTSVAGDDAALYNSLLLTVQDAGQHPGRKVIVVFSNGPDNSSMVPPEDVAELAQSAGIPIYMISTTEAQL